MSDQPHILVVDDDDRLRGLLKRYLSESGFRVTAASDADDARARMRGLAFDLIVLDRMMPGQDGIGFTEDLRRAGHRVPVLMLTALGEPEHRIAGLEVGVDDYLPKPFEPRELVLRIEAILRRFADAPAPASHSRFGEFRFDIERGELSRDGEPVRLTTTETELLRIFARRPGETIDRVELLTQTGAASDRAVDVQITRLRRKIEADPKAPRYLQTVWGQGYVLWPDPPEAG